MDNDTVIWIIVAIVIALVLLALVAMAVRRKQQRDADDRRVHAEQLRQRVTATSPDLTEAQLRAQEAEAQARLARTEAQRADQRAAEEQQRMAAEEAHREDLVREADRVDPDVDHRAEDYSPGVDDPRPDDATGGTHRG